MIIVCPHCNSEYEVAAQAIGEKGRLVQCVNCTQSWTAKQEAAEPPKRKKPQAREVELADDSDDFSKLLDDAMTEEGLAPLTRAQKKALAEENKNADGAQSAEGKFADETDLDRELESMDPGATGPVDIGQKKVEGARDAAQDVVRAMNEKDQIDSASYATRRRTRIDRMKRTSRVAKRHRDIARALPMARTRRMVTMGSFGMAMAVLLSLYSFRVDVVRAYPEMASLYRLFGTEVNVVGLDFANVRTIRSWKDGHEVLNVTGDIRNVTNKITYLPSIRVALVRNDDSVIYEWNMTPGLSVLEAGGSFEFSTQLLSPPNDVRHVKLSFLDWQASEKPNASSGQ